MDQRHVATCANHCWQQLPWHARHVGDDDDDDDDGGDDDCVAPVMGNETDMDVDVDVGCGMRTCRMNGMGRGTAEWGNVGMAEVVSYIKCDVNHELDWALMGFDMFSNAQNIARLACPICIRRIRAESEQELSLSLS